MNVGISCDEAERLLLAFLERRRSSGDAVALEELGRNPPEVVSLVRSMCDRYEQAQNALAGLRPGEVAALGPAASQPGATPKPYRYEVVREVARGGMGTILEVRDRELRRTLAMKVARDEPTGDPELDALRIGRRRARLFEEAQILGQLDHPGVPPVHEVGVDAQGRVYFTMPLVRGADLGATLAARRRGEPAANGQLHLPRLVGVLLRVCESVAYAHEKGVVHRDLKPRNVMIDDFGGVLVLDWGLARVRGTPLAADVRLATPVRTDRSEGGNEALRTIEGDAVGTPCYMAPEQARGELDRVDARADVYAIGAILYEILAGSPPYADRGEGASAVLSAVLAGPPTPLAASAPRAPAELVAISERAMQRRPEDRYASLAELADDLRSFLEDRVVRAHRTGALAELRKWTRRNRGAAVAIGTVALAMVAIAVTQTIATQEQARLGQALEAELYSSRISLALRALDQDEVGVAAAAHAGCPSDRRGWEWHYLARSLDTSDRTFRDHQGAVVHSVAWSRDGAFVASGDEREVVVVRPAHAAGSPILLRPPSDEMRTEQLEFSPDDAWLLQNFPCRRWDWRLAKLAFDHGGSTDQILQAVTWLEDGRYAGTSLTSLRIFDGTNDRKLIESETGTRDGRVVRGVPGRPMIVVGDDRGVLRLFSTSDGAAQGTLDTGGGTILDLSCSADGRWLAAAPVGREVIVVDLERLAIVARLPRARSTAYCVAIAPDGRRLASANGDVVETWRGQAADWTHEARLIGHLGTVHALRFDPTGRWLATAGGDSTVRLWDLTRTEREPHPTPVPAAGAPIAWSPDGSMVAVADGIGSRGIALCDGTTGQPIGQIPCGEPVFDVVWSRQGVLAASAKEGRIVFWRPPAPEPIAELRAHDTPFPARALAFSPDGDVLALHALYGVAAWRWASRERLWVRAPREGGTVLDLAYSPDGQSLAWCGGTGNTGEAGVLRASDGADLVSLGVSEQRSQWTSWSRDGRRVVVSGPARRIWVGDAATGATLWQIDAPNRSIAPVFGATGERLFAGGSDGTLQVYDAASGASIASFRSHAGLILDCAVSPDGTRVATFDIAARLRIHDARPWAR